MIVSCSCLSRTRKPPRNTARSVVVVLVQCSANVHFLVFFHPSIPYPLHGNRSRRLLYFIMISNSMPKCCVLFTQSAATCRLITAAACTMLLLCVETGFIFSPVFVSTTPSPTPPPHHLPLKAKTVCSPLMVREVVPP